MNYTICLNPASFNLANLSGNNLLIYTDDDNFTTPVASVPSSLLFPPPIGSCPYTISGIPDGATQLLIVDNCAASEAGGTVPANTLTGECCYALIDIDPLLCFDFCEDCGIGFDAYSLSTTGSIIAGSLTSSCGEATDYVIGWYLNGDYSSPAFTSGYGTQFNYQLTHPLTSSAAPLVAAGNWEGVIHDIIIAGTQYSTISGSGNGTNIPFQSCFGTTVAAPLKCDNGSFPLPYSHQKTFTAVSNGVPPAPSTFTYALSSSTNYFAYLFEGQQVWDELEIKYISGNPNGTTNPALYSQPIYLEKIRVGFNAPVSNTSPLWTLTPGGVPSTYPVNASYQNNFRRTITLTGLETSSIPSSPDRLEITVTPNTVNFTTNWNLYMQCLEDFDCSNCTFDTNPPFKISQIDLDRPTGNSCPQQRLRVVASGCFENGTSSDLFGTTSFPNISYVQTNNAFSPQDFTIPNSGYVQLDDTVTCANSFGGAGTSCMPSTPNTITFEKNNNFSNGIASTGQALGQIKFTFNDVNDFTFYQNKINAIESTLINTIGPLTTDCTSPQYYSGYSLTVPVQALNNSCGDNTTTLTYYIHRTAYPNIIYFADPANNNWEITIPMLECDDCLSFSGCTNCLNNIYGYPAILGTFNSSSYADNTNLVSYSNNFAAKYSNPFAIIYFTTSSFGASTFYSSSLYYATSVAQGINQYSMVTVPFIPNALNPGSWTHLSALSGSACPDWLTKFSSSVQTSHTGPIHQAYYYDFSYVFPNLNDDINFAGNNDFHLFTKVTNNSGVLQANPLLIYSYSQSIVTVHQPSFFVGGTPTLTIDPF
jgi:hypothetical protein